MAILRAWLAYKQANITLYDLRVWFACFELVARRYGVAHDRPRRYTFDEIHRLVGGASRERVQASISRLQTAGLLAWSETALQLLKQDALHSEIEQDDFQRMLDLVTNHRRKVPVPRRTIRLIAATTKPVVIATMLGHLLRCLYFRDGLCQPEGRCKASWIADVFGVDLRNVKAARQHLLKMEWLHVQPSPQTALNRWGARVCINLEWGTAVSATPPVLPPPNNDLPPQLPPPRENRNLSSRSINQKPPASKPAGFSIPSQQAPTWRHVVLNDLKEPTRLACLFAETVRRGICPDTEASRLQFFAAAARAQRVGTLNPCGLFVSIIQKGLWRFISNGDEDTARRQLAQSRWQAPTRVHTAPSPVPANDQHWMRNHEPGHQQNGGNGPGTTCTPVKMVIQKLLLEICSP